MSPRRRPGVGHYAPPRARPHFTRPRPSCFIGADGLRRRGWQGRLQRHPWLAGHARNRGRSPGGGPTAPGRNGHVHAARSRVRTLHITAPWRARSSVTATGAMGVSRHWRRLLQPGRSSPCCSRARRATPPGESILIAFSQVASPTPSRRPAFSKVSLGSCSSCDGPRWRSQARSRQARRAHLEPRHRCPLRAYPRGHGLRQAITSWRVAGRASSTHRALALVSPHAWLPSSPAPAVTQPATGPTLRNIPKSGYNPKTGM